MHIKYKVKIIVTRIIKISYPQHPLVFIKSCNLSIKLQCPIHTKQLNSALFIKTNPYTLLDLLQRLPPIMSLRTAAVMWILLHGKLAEESKCQLSACKEDLQLLVSWHTMNKTCLEILEICLLILFFFSCKECELFT